MTPIQNGKVERSHLTDDEEVYNQREFRKPAKRRKPPLTSFMVPISALRA